MAGTGLMSAIREPRVGVALATLVPDPYTCASRDLLRAADAATAAGFPTLSVWPTHLRPGPRSAWTGTVRAWRGRVCVVESAMGFTRGVTPRFADDIRHTVGLAAAVGARIISVCTLLPEIDSEDAAAGLAALGSAACEEGLGVCLEFLPWTAVSTLADAWSLVQRTGLDSVGLMVDAWHFQRQPGGPDYDLLEAIPGNRVRCVQLSDTAPDPATDVMTEAMTARRLPGDGVVDFSRLGRSLAAIGAEPLYIAEVFNAALAASGAHRAAMAVRGALDALCADTRLDS